MNAQIERRAIPTLMGGQRRQQQPGYGQVQTLVDLLGDGFYLLYMLKHGSAPPEETRFFNSITALLAEFDRAAGQLRATSADIEAAKYAFCAALDEIILSSDFSLRAGWERRPLQLVIFGDQLAGEHFFDRLEVLRSGGAARLPALQVFQMCLLIGFKGRYAREPQDKLAYLIARLGEEIAGMQGKSKGFAPQAQRPDQIVNKLRSHTPVWSACAIFALVALGTYGWLSTNLEHSTQDTLASYQGLIKLPPRPAYVTITLP